MSEPRKPIFGFLWPKPDPNAPVDDAYRQERWVRITPRGPLRVAALLLASTATVIGISMTVLANVQVGLTVPGLAASAVCATALLLVLRGWVVGTYVTDDQVRVETTWRRRTLPWSQVTAITVATCRGPFLGLPVPVPVERAQLRLVSGDGVATHVSTGSPDLWLRREAFDIAVDRLANWRDHR